MINLLCLDHVESLINTVIGPPGVVSVQLDLSFVPSMFVKFGKTTPWRLIEAGDCQNYRFQFTHCLGVCKIMRWYITKRKGKASELLRAENTIPFKTLRKTSHVISNGGVEVFGFLLDQMRCTVFIILCTTAIFFLGEPFVVDSLFQSAKNSDLNHHHTVNSVNLNKRNFAAQILKKKRFRTDVHNHMKPPSCHWPSPQTSSWTGERRKRREVVCCDHELGSVRHRSMEDVKTVALGLAAIGVCVCGHRIHWLFGKVNLWCRLEKKLQLPNYHHPIVSIVSLLCLSGSIWELCA